MRCYAAPMAQDVSDEALGRVLDLQGEDSEITRLHARRESVPEALRLAEVRAQLAELDADLEIAAKQLEEIGLRQGRLEGEIELLELKLAKEEQRLFSGAVSNPKELSSLQAEVEMLKRKRTGLEDELLDVMEQREAAAETESSLRVEWAESADEEKRLAATVDEFMIEIDSQLETHAEARKTLASEIPDVLLELYDKTRAAKHGVGAAALVGDTCQGCHTKLPAAEVERLRSERGLQRCDNCRRLLIVI
jgi:predicted  nucleic acid-binding Zn-ribbon protein